MVRERPDLRPYAGKSLTVIAWIWARTVKSPNPAFGQVDVPLASTFLLSTKPGKEAYIEPVIENRGYRFTVKVGAPRNADALKNGTRAGKAQDFLCLMSGVPVARSYVRDEGKAGRLGARLMAVVAEGDGGRVYLSPNDVDDVPAMRPDEASVVVDARSTFLSGLTPTRAMITGGVCSAYGLTTWGSLFSPRQVIALTTFSDLVLEAREQVKRDALAVGLPDDSKALATGGSGLTAYADAIAAYLAFAVDKGANYWSSVCAWHITRDGIVSTFGRQAIPMVFDYAEANPLSSSSGNWDLGIEQAGKMLEALGMGAPGMALQADAASQTTSTDRVVSTDPPYYNNIGYADLSDFFYVWLRRSLKQVFPSLFATLAAPKAEELVATLYRHGSKEKAEAFFLDGMTQAMHRLADQAHPAFPVTIYYAFRQSESTSSHGVSNTGWDTFLAAVIAAGLAISGTWPVRTEYTGNLKKNISALASSIVLVCRKRSADATSATRREFAAALKSELPNALTQLQRGNFPPSTSPRRRSARAWPSTPVARKCSTPRARRSRFAKR